MLSSTAEDGEIEVRISARAITFQRSKPGRQRGFLHHTTTSPPLARPSARSNNTPINNDSSSGSLVDGVVYDEPKRAILESYTSTLESLENIMISNDTNNVNPKVLNLDEDRNTPPSSPGWSSLEPVMDSDYELALASVLVNKNHSHPESSRNTVSSHIFAPTKNNKDGVAEVLTTEEDSETATTRVKWSDWGDSETRRVNSTTNFTGLGSLLDLYNPYKLSESWEVLKARVNLSRQCGEEYGTFLEELHRGTPWALKALRGEEVRGRRGSYDVTPLSDLQEKCRPTVPIESTFSARVSCGGFQTVRAPELRLRGGTILLPESHKSRDRLPHGTDVKTSLVTDFRMELTLNQSVELNTTSALVNYATEAGALDLSGC
uniref:Uncharacterized protein n=1 Tax=Timema shepardi TaxID=629360 RepID=A0A7R9AYS5_TIMSH|nr:unnamed protein product [Timema shepardi]